MIFLSDAILEKKRELMRDIDDGKVDRERTLKQILDLDPNDQVALGLLAAERWDAGDQAAAEELAWRAAQAQPCAWAPYLQLSALVSDREPLAKGLTELACRKMLADDEALEALEENLPPYEWKNLPEMEALSTVEKFEVLTGWLREQRDLEPLAVTARLRPFRLIHQLQEADVLDRGLVDALVQEGVQEGSTIVPLLAGVLRAWVEYVIPEENDRVAGNSLALLGEIGDTSAIRDLLEMTAAKEPALSGAAQWALDRIVSRHPEEATAVIREIAPDLDSNERIAVVETLMRYPKIDPGGTLFERLFEKLDRLDKESRDACFQIMLPAVAARRGRAGTDAARSLLRRYGSLLSRNTRRACEDVIEELSVTPFDPSSLAPSPWTVYQICSGEADWEVDSEDVEDDEEDYVPEPVRKKVAPGRNDPCWCGSGKKYKKCHLDADEQADREIAEKPNPSPQNLAGEFDNLRSEVGKILDKLPRKEQNLALTEFFGPNLADKDTGVTLLVDWMVHDRISETLSHTVMEEYLRRNAPKLSERERKFVESSIGSYFDLYEVQDVKEGTGVEVKSLTTEGTFFVHDIRMSKVLVRWDGLFARMVDGERGHEFSGAGATIPRNQMEAIRSWMEADKRRTGLAWPAYLKRNWPRIRALREEIAREWMDSLKITNTDGEEMVVSKALYRVINRGALIASLRSCLEIDESEEGTSFVWLDGPASEPGHTVLGKIRVVGGELTFECNSKKRLKRAKTLLGELAGPAVLFQKDEFMTQEELKESITENPRSAKSSRDDDEMPAGVKRQIVRDNMEKHYAEWPDMKLGALGGKTPRQAVKNAAGKRKVAELLKQIENTEDRKRKGGEYAFDVSKLRAELGIKG